MNGSGYYARMAYSNIAHYVMNLCIRFVQKICVLGPWMGHSFLSFLHGSVLLFMCVSYIFISRETQAEREREGERAEWKNMLSYECKWQETFYNYSTYIDIYINIQYIWKRAQSQKTFHNRKPLHTLANQRSTARMKPEAPQPMNG